MNVINTANGTKSTLRVKSQHANKLFGSQFSSFYLNNYA
jgi:hypothetical protein